MQPSHPANTHDVNEYLAHPAPSKGHSPTSSTKRAAMQTSLEDPTLVVTGPDGKVMAAPRHQDSLPAHHTTSATAASPSGADAGLTQEDIDAMIAKDKNKRIIVVDNVVYDVTHFAPHHPGGASVFVSGNGKNVSTTFHAMHSERTKSRLQKWAIGGFLKERPKPLEAASVSASPATTHSSANANPSGKDGEGPEEAGEHTFTLAEVHRHIEQNPHTLIVILFGDVYDITAFASKHPGGRRVLESNNGKECGETFMRIHGLRARAMVPEYLIGRLKNAPPMASPLRSATATGADADSAAPLSVAQQRANSTRLLESEPLATCGSFRYLTFASPFRMNVPPGGHVKIYSNVARGEGRFYTPYKTELASFSVCVKHYPNGRTSTHLFNLRPGDEVYYDGPFAPAWMAHSDPYLNDTRIPNTEKHVLLLAGGTGLSPLYTIARDLLQRQTAQVTLLLSVQNPDQLVLGEELAALEARYNEAGKCGCSIFVAFSQSFSSATAAPQAGEGLRLTKENTLYGKIDAKMLRRLPLPRATQAAVVCGPPAFNDAMVRATVEAAVCGERRIHVLD